MRQAADRGYRSLDVNTDSEFLVNAQERWVPRWERNGWQTADGRSVVNRDELQSLNQAIRDSDMDVRFNHTRGHAGNWGNEQADMFARQGANQHHQYRRY